MAHTLSIFASGTGSNAVRLVQHFQGHSDFKIGLLICNKAEAPVIAKMHQLGIPALVLPKALVGNGLYINKVLQVHDIEGIILAGYLQLVPLATIQAFSDRIINIHPALLPKYGGKGMYGMHVHEAVMQAGEKESGITVHTVDEEYDRGTILHQERLPFTSAIQTASDLAQAIHQLEWEHYPPVAERYFKQVLLP